MKQKPCLRCLSVLLILCLLLSGLPVSGAAAQAVGTEESLSPAPEPPLQEETITPEPLDTGGILSLVDAQTFEAQGFTRRVTEDESLSTYVFQKETGEKTVYFFGENVKYEKDGVIYHKDLTLVPQSGGYGVAQNEVALHLPQNPAKGILVAYGGMGIRILPQGLASGIQGIAENGAVVYENAYGNGIDLKYTPIFSGVKEDIILPQYMQEASFSFLLETVGASLYQDSQGWYLAADAQAEPALRMGDTLVYDAIGKPCQGGLTVETVTPGSQYRVTVSAPDSFLSDPETVYPVTVDPSITISVDLNGSDAIDDASIFEYLPDYNYGSLVYNNVGTTNASMGRSRTVIKLNELIRSAEYAGITNPEQIESVYFYAAESSGRPAQRIYIYPLLNESWTVSNVTWNNVGAYSTSLFCSGYLTDSQWTGFDITRLVRAWKAGTYPANGGFIMINENESDHKSFFANNGSYYHPYVTMQYGLFEDATPISVNAVTNVELSERNEKKYYSVSVGESGFYRFYSEMLNDDDDPRGWLYNEFGQKLAYCDDIDDELYDFSFKYYLKKDHIYYFVIDNYGGDSATIPVHLFLETNLVDLTEHISGHISNTSTTQITFNSSNQFKIYSYIPSKSGRQGFYTSSPSIGAHPTIQILGTSLNMIACSQNEAGQNAMVTCNMEKNSTYYVLIFHKNTSTEQMSIHGLMPVDLSDGRYYALHNMDTMYYLDAPITENGSYVQQSAFNTNAQETWKIHTEDNYAYSFETSKISALFLSTNYTNSIKVRNTIDNYSLWYILKTQQGYYIIESAQYPGKVLNASSSAPDRILRLDSFEYAQLSNWLFEPRSNTQLEAQQTEYWCWAATARMFANHYYPDREMPSQYNAVTEVYNPLYAHGANEVVAAQAIQYYLNPDNYQKEAQQEVRLTYCLSVENLQDPSATPTPARYSEELLRQFLDDGHVLYIARTLYKPTITSSHAYLICGYTVVETDNGLEYNYILYDPMPDPIPNQWLDEYYDATPIPGTGCAYLRTYQWICDNRSDPTYEDCGRWEGFIVRATSYSHRYTLW